MQKKLIALAIAGLAAAPAFAQTNVQIYGVVDAAYEQAGAMGAAGVQGNFSNGNTATASTLSTAGTFTGGSLVTNNNWVSKNSTENNNSTYRSRVTSHSSHIGFRGTEDVGNGMKVIWQVENQIMMDSNNGLGTQVNQGWATRETFVGLASPAWGTVRLGYQNLPSYAMSAKYDIYPGATTFSNYSAVLGRTMTFNNNAAGGVGAGGTTAGNWDGRAQAVAYISPNFGGFSVLAAYVPNEGKQNDDAGASGVKLNPYAWGANLNYDNGGFAATLSHQVMYDQGTNGLGQIGGNATANTIITGINNSAWSQSGFTSSAATSGTHTYLGQSTDKNTRVGMRYNMGAFEVTGVYEWLRLATNLTSVGTTVGRNTNLTYNRNGYMLGARYTTGVHTFRAHYAHAADGSCSITAVNSCNNEGQNVSQWSLGYNYALSKRTDLYARYTRLDNDSNARNDGTSGQWTMAGSNGAVTGALYGNGADPTIFSFGIRHNF